VKRAIVNVRHLADQIVMHLTDRPSPKVTISDETDAELDTGGGVKRALPLLGGGAFLLRNSDSFWLEGVRPNLQWLAGGWDESRMDALLLLASTVKAVGYSGRGDFTLDPDGRLARRQERRIAPFVYAGAAIFSPRLFAKAPDGRFCAARRRMDQCGEPRGDRGSNAGDRRKCGIMHWQTKRKTSSRLRRARRSSTRWSAR
jgi:MurNAc alpha-1-phosphate uridylyltransferase